MTPDREPLHIPTLIAAAEQMLGVSQGYLNRKKGTPRPLCKQMNEAWKQLAEALGHGSMVWVLAKDIMPGLHIHHRDSHGNLVAYQVAKVRTEAPSDIRVELQALDGPNPGVVEERVFSFETPLMMRLTE